MCTICSALRPYSSECDYEGLNAASVVTETTDAAHDTSTTYTMEVNGSFEGVVESGTLTVSKLAVAAGLLSDGG